MLKIDYALVPLTERDRELVEEDVLRRVHAGALPQVARSLSGRLVVLNPDPVQTVHQIPDDLRPRLRRVLMPTQEASTHLGADKLYQYITESDEPLYIVVVELQSEFRSLVSFLDYVPRIHELHPGLGLFISGSATHLMEKLAQLAGDPQVNLELRVAGRSEPLRVDDAETLARTFTLREDLATFSVPFFSQLRLLVNRKDSGPVTVNMGTMRTLHPVFGHGDPVEVELGKGRKERMLVVDLPIQVIRDLQFRTDRGPEFFGIVRDDREIPSKRFGDEKLEYRWVPLRSLQGFLRRGPDGEPQRIDLNQIRLLRVNCLTGQVGFVMKESAERISLESVRAVTVYKRRPVPASRRGEAEAEAEEPLQVRFSKVLHPNHMAAAEDPVQLAVRDHFYGHLIHDEVERTRKLEVYAQRLRAGAVGPLAGQTLKLLRRFGLERLIDPDGFFYLCDAPEDIPDFDLTPERFAEHFENLIGLLRNVAGGQPSERIRVNDIAYNLPISTEWVDTGLSSFDSASAQELEAVYQEMSMLQGFIGHEFQRQFDVAQEDMLFFSNMEDCRSAGLLAKWLSEVKRGSYGKMLPAGQHPDFVFYGNAQDKRENDRRFFFPSLACAELFKRKETQALFQEADYDFSVFLEEQLAIGVHELREKGALEPDAGQLRNWFDGKGREHQQVLMDLRAQVEAFDDTSSPIYQQLLEEEEATFHDRFQAFVRDRERVEEELRGIGERYVRNLSRLEPMLQEIDPATKAAFADSGEAAELREQRILKAARDGRDKLIEQVQTVLSRLLDGCRQWLAVLEAVPQDALTMLKQQATWQRAQEKRQQAVLEARRSQHLEAREEALARFNAQEREGQAARVRAQLDNVQNELHQLDARLHEQRQKSQQTIGSVIGALGRAREALEPFAAPDALDRPEEALHRIDTVRQHLAKLAASASTLVERTEPLMEGLERVRVRRLRYIEQLHHLRVDAALLGAAEAAAEAPPAGQRVPASSALAKLEQQWKALRDKLRNSVEPLGQQESAVGELARLCRGELARLNRFRERHAELARLTSRQSRLRDAARGLAERQEMMQGEMKDLPHRVRQQFMPARKKLLLDVFVPETEKRGQFFRQAMDLVGEMVGLSEDHLRGLYLDHAIHRRFHSRQFHSGWAFSNDSASPRLMTLRNVHPALTLLLQSFRHNFASNGQQRMRPPELSRLPSATVPEIMQRFEMLAGQTTATQVNYVVLPATLSEDDGVAVLNRKDDLFNGVPRVVGIFVTKFDAKRVITDTAFREAYFRALKHNVIVNVDGHDVVDNPRAIATRLLHETLGSAIDLEHVEEPPEVQSAADG